MIGHLDTPKLRHLLNRHDARPPLAFRRQDNRHLTVNLAILPSPVDGSTSHTHHTAGVSRAFALLHEGGNHSVLFGGGEIGNTETGLHGIKDQFK
ncbi:hypothetical protein LWC05_03205 [Acetobacter sicerae]|uniref:Uncharacterized protein n=1 Tax=Acetobacter sicerae TaxID=85325 RepID=A0ABS8VTM0_9PROT|nr:hypothetical protein [Acetobacter sicerae]MCE0742899.1 hypothetical protein [Acetobacter sicerae]